MIVEASWSGLEPVRHWMLAANERELNYPKVWETDHPQVGGPGAEADIG